MPLQHLLMAMLLLSKAAVLGGCAWDMNEALQPVSEKSALLLTVFVRAAAFSQLLVRCVVGNSNSLPL